MKTHCSSCKKVTVYKNSCVRKTKQNRLMLLSNCVICGKNSAFIKKSNFVKTNNLIIFQMISLKLVCI